MSQNEAASPTPRPETTTLDLVADCLRAFTHHGMRLESRLDNEQREHHNTRWGLKATQTSLGEAHRVMDDRLVRLNNLEALLEDAKALIMNGDGSKGLRTSTENHLWPENRDRWLDDWTEVFGTDPRKEDRPQLRATKQPAGDNTGDADD